MEQDAIEVISLQVFEGCGDGLCHLVRKWRLWIVRYPAGILAGQRGEFGLQVEVGAGETFSSAGGNAGTYTRLIVMLGLTGGVNAAKSVLYGKIHQLLGGGLLPGGAVDDPRDADFTV